MGKSDKPDGMALLRTFSRSEILDKLWEIDKVITVHCSLSISVESELGKGSCFILSFDSLLMSS